MNIKHQISLMFSDKISFKKKHLTMKTTALLQMPVTTSSKKEQTVSWFN